MAVAVAKKNLCNYSEVLDIRSNHPSHLGRTQEMQPQRKLSSAKTKK